VRSEDDAKHSHSGKQNPNDYDEYIFKKSENPKSDEPSVRPKSDDILVRSSDEHHHHHHHSTQEDEKSINDEIKDYYFKPSHSERKRVKKRSSSSHSDSQSSSHHSHHSHHSSASHSHTSSENDVDNVDNVDNDVISNDKNNRDIFVKSDHESFRGHGWLRRFRSRSSSHHHHHHHSSKKRKQLKRWQKIALSIISGLLALIIIVISIVGFLINRGQKELFDDYNILLPDGIASENNGEYIVYNGHTYQYNKNITSMLFMGIDVRELEGKTVNGTAGQSDVMVLMAMDVSTGKVSLVNISRDTMADIAEYSAAGSYVGTSNEQICLAYAYGDGKEGSCQYAVTAVQRLFYNVPIKSYMSLDLNGIETVNDSIGGVDVISPETIDIFTAGESYHLEGDMAEKFVRARNTELVDSNNYRMQRQQVYLESFIDKLVAQTKEKISAPLNVYNSSKSYMCTNINPSKISYISSSVLRKRTGVYYEMLNVPGEISMGEKYAEFHIDETAFFELFLSVYYIQLN
jgi:LCP family protein required for cell wall assembly